MDFDNLPVTCAVIKVEEINNNPLNKGKLKDGYRYKARYEDIAYIIDYLTKTFNDLHLPYKPYLTGFDFVSESRIWTKERILECALRDIKQQYELKETNNVYYK